MASLIEFFALLSTPLRALAFLSQALSVGGVAFILLLAIPLAARLDPALGSDLLRRAGRITAAAGVGVALIAAARTVGQLTELVVEAGIPLGQALGAGFVAAWGAQAMAGLAIAALLARRRDAPGPGVMACLAIAALVIVAGSVATSHAVGRLEGGAVLAAATAFHGLAAAVWIGGLPCFLAALARAGDNGVALRAIGRRYSVMSISAVAVLAGAGGLLAIAYVGSWTALVGTAYGLMTGVKITLFLLLLGLGAANYRVVEGLRRDPATPALRLRRFAEVEWALASRCSSPRHRSLRRRPPWTWRSIGSRLPNSPSAPGLPRRGCGPPGPRRSGPRPRRSRRSSGRTPRPRFGARRGTAQPNRTRTPPTSPGPSTSMTGRGSSCW